MELVLAGVGGAREPEVAGCCLCAYAGEAKEPRVAGCCLGTCVCGTSASLGPNARPQSGGCGAKEPEDGMPPKVHVYARLVLAKGLMRGR